MIKMELTLSDNMSKILDFVGETGAFLKIESDTGFTQPRSDHISVIDVLLCRCREDDDIIQVDEAKLPLEARQCNVEGTLESSGGVGESEWHGQRMVNTSMRCKLSILPVIRE